jgi:RNA polymerase sigma-70 factor (ECF subfamily)
VSEVVTVSSDAERSGLEEATAARLRAQLVSYLVGCAGDRRVAEDLAQEAMLHVVRGLPKFRGAAQLRTWARRVALNVWRDHLRRRAASPVERAANGEVFSVNALLDSIGPAAPALSPEDAYDRRVTQDCLLAAARRLPLAEREVILLHDFGTIPLERAAASLGCSLSAARVRLHRARRHLAELCRAECTSDAGPDGTTLCSPATREVPPAMPSSGQRRNVRKRRK